MKRSLLCAVLGLLLLISAVSAEGTPVSMRNADGTISQNVRVKALGSVLSVVKGENGELTLPSSWLIWDRTAPLDQHFAYIYYTKSTKVNLRLTEKPKSSIIDKAKVGRIVMVADVGESYSRVIYEGQVGWLPNSVLRFLTPAQTEPLYAVISYQGQTTGKKQINLRQGPSKSSKTLVKLTVGQTAVALGLENGWYELEVNGWHGYVQEAFLTPGGPVVLEELSAPAADSADSVDLPEPAAALTNISAFLLSIACCCSGV